MSNSKRNPNGCDFTSIIHSDTYPTISPTAQPDLKSKHVFITGASKGVGRATSISFAQAGASKIGIAARSSLESLEEELADAAKKAGHPVPETMSFKMDVVDRKAIESTVKEIERVFEGRLDVLVNNAGYLENFRHVSESDPEDYWKTWEVNMKGPYLVTRAFLPLIMRGGNKQIINISSIGAHLRTNGASAYQCTKLALCRFTEFLMDEEGSNGLMAYALHPGGVMTELARGMPKEAHSILTDEPQLAADTITFLARGKHGWLAGRYVSSTWDMPELLSMKDDIVTKDLLKVRMAV